MKITDLRIGDRVQNKSTKFQMTVVAIFEDETVYLDFDGNEGGVWEYNIEDLEFCEPRYKLPEWKRDEEFRSLYAIVENPLCAFEYWIDNICGIQLYLHREIGDADNAKMLGGGYPSIEAAQQAAEKHYNELVSELIEKLSSTHLANEEVKTTEII